MEMKEVKTALVSSTSSIEQNLVVIHPRVLLNFKYLIQKRVVLLTVQRVTKLIVIEVLPFNLKNESFFLRVDVNGDLLILAGKNEG